MIKYQNLKELHTFTRKDFYPINTKLDEVAQSWSFLTKFWTHCKEVHALAVHYNVTYNFHKYTMYLISIGSTKPDAVLGIDFIILHYYVPEEGLLPTLKNCYSFYLIMSGPSLTYNTRVGTPMNASIVLNPPSALFFKHFDHSSYATAKSHFNVYCCFLTARKTVKVLSQFWPNLLIKPSPYKTKCYCKINNRYIKKLKKLGLMPNPTNNY
ncbi:hypothetical protein [Ureaplasma ceti]|uniref:Uncharacterized protein n=1 Tax=Ureaplasma ceti TaxID=3119530 RepID=A0ABP9U5J6_9BACT